MTMTISEIKELNEECCQTNCNRPATYYVFWPGDGKKMMCEEDKNKAIRIANVMGFNLYTEEKL